MAGAGSPGLLTFADTRLCLGGGAVECMVGKKTSGSIATAHATQPSLTIGGEPDSVKTTVTIIDLALARQPIDAELAAAVALVEKGGLVQFCRMLFNANEFVYID